MAINNDQQGYKKLSRVLTTPDKPDNLEQVLLDNFEKQALDDKSSTDKKKHNHLFFLSSLAASLFVGLGIMLKIYIFSSPVALAYKHAYEHAQEERLITGHLDGGYQQWMSDRGIAVPINAEAIVLSKNCLISKVKTIHLRFEFDGIRQSKSVINLFIRTVGNNQTEIQNTSGDVSGQKWALFKPNKEIEVLVLYKNNSYKQQVDDIVKSMFSDKGKIVI